MVLKKEGNRRNYNQKGQKKKGGNKNGLEEIEKTSEEKESD